MLFYAIVITILSLALVVPAGEDEQNLKKFMFGSNHTKAVYFFSWLYYSRCLLG